MQDIITNGSEIKQRILSEINNAKACVYIAMAYFTDRDIANAIIEAKNRNVTVDIILSSNAQNEIVRLMFRDANISVHAFETGDARGIMHHKFCLIDNKISINGSYNFSYNASNNNVENIHVSDDSVVHDQLLMEFERLKENIDKNISVNAFNTKPINGEIRNAPINKIESFSGLLHNLVYSSAQINTEDYKKKGYEKSKESFGHVDILRVEYNNIKEELRVYTTNDNLGSLKNIMVSNIANAYETSCASIEYDRNAELSMLKKEHEIESRYLNERMNMLKQEKVYLEIGNDQTGERGLVQGNRDLEKNKLEQSNLEQAFVLKKFWSVGTVIALLGLIILSFYLSMFFASAIYKVFFEGNVIQKSLEAGINPGLPQLVDANAVLKIYKQQGTLFGIMAMLFFLIPILLSNLELLGSQKKWVNNLSFWVGVLIFDVVVSTMVAINTDEIKSLLVGNQSRMELWEVIKHGEFWLIFVFGMIPLIITHYLITNIENAYKKSSKELFNAEKAHRMHILEKELIELISEKDSLSNKIRDKQDLIKENQDQIHAYELKTNTVEDLISGKYALLRNQVTSIYEEIKSRIITGKIFTEEIIESVISAYKSGFIEYLPEYYAESEVTKRVKEIEEAIKVNS